VSITTRPSDLNSPLADVKGGYMLRPTAWQEQTKFLLYVNFILQPCLEHIPMTPKLWKVELYQNLKPRKDGGFFQILKKPWQEGREAPYEE